MKNNKYDQEDNLFRKTLQNKKNYIASQQDRELFKIWIDNLDKPKKENEQMIDSLLTSHTVSSSKDYNDLSSWDAGELFRNWVDNNSEKIHQYTQHKKIHANINKQQHKQKKNIPTIDLHGNTRADALSKAKAFIFQCLPHYKKIRIIHGKGLTQGKPSIIRQDIREWLAKEIKNSLWLLDFSYESPENGGHGATIIWLKQGEKI